MQHVIAALAARFPALFTPGPPKPLKLRIQADIQQRAPGTFTRKALSAFLHRHTTSTAYLKALVAAQTRFDLDGAPAGEIAAEHREAAAAELARRRAIVQARRQGAGPGAGRVERPAADAKPAGAAPVAPPAGPPRRGGRGPGPDAGGAGPAQPRHRQPDRPGRDARPPGDRPAHHKPFGPFGSVKKADTRRPAPEVQRAATRPEAATARPAAAPAEAAWPTDDAQRARAMLLRAWETSPLAKANFCALKRLGEADFDAQIAQARAERDARR